MDYENLMAKLASQQLQLPPAMQDVMQRVREVGLHKVAAQMHGMPEFGVRQAAELIGSSLVRAHLRQTKIAAGLRAYDALVEVGELPLARPR